MSREKWWQLAKIWMENCHSHRSQIDCLASQVNSTSLILHAAHSTEAGQSLSQGHQGQRSCWSLYWVNAPLTMVSLENGPLQRNLDELGGLGKFYVALSLFRVYRFLILSTMTCAFWHCRIFWGLNSTGIVLLNIRIIRSDAYGSQHVLGASS